MSLDEESDPWDFETVRGGTYEYETKENLRFCEVLS